MNKTLNTEQLKALHLIERFNPKCLHNGAFQQIEKNEFIHSLKALITNPIGITQGVHPLCGIASAIKIAAQLDPVNLVKMGGHLYANGNYRTRSFLQKAIKVPTRLKKMQNTDGLTPANFVLQSTVKSFYNPLTGYNNKPGSKFNEWQGITFPYQLVRFLTSYFKIERVPMRTFFHTIEEIQEVLKKPVKLLAWTSWNQMKKPGGRFKLLQQHYVLIKQVDRVGEEVQVIIDNPRKSNDRLQRFTFKNEKQFYKAIIGVYAFRRRN